MNKNDVLNRAKDILINSPLTGFSAQHGEYCPYCAIALAKTQLDEEQDNYIPIVEMVSQSVFGVELLESDEPLEDARLSLGDVGEPFTKEGSIEAITKALSE